MARDDIFRNEEAVKGFVFDDRVANVFDDMADRSVPFYREVIAMTCQILQKFLREGDQVYDLGCATGSTLLELARQLDLKGLEFTGLDNSAAMLAKARAKAEMFSKSERVNFLEQDILSAELKETGAVVLNYTLQFIPPPEREAFLKKVHSFLRQGGVLIVSEKVLGSDVALNDEFTSFYHDYKKKRGYSELEIARKREALENVLVPLSIQENIDMLRAVGFVSVESFFQWYNFASFVAIKY